MVLRANELQLTRGESIRDTALVFSRHAAAIGLRTGSERAPARARRLRRGAGGQHALARPSPVQALADLMTMREAFGALEARVLAYVGDGNNVARSLAIVGTLAGRRGARRGARRLPAPRAARRGADRRPGGGRRRRRRRSTPTCGSRWATMRPRPGSAARRSRPTASTTRCSTAPPPARSRCTACPRTRAKRSPRRCSTAAPAHLGPGREPPPRAEGVARVARWVGSGDHATATPDEPQEGPGIARPRR